MRAVLGHGLSPRKPGSVSRFSPSPSVHPKGCTPHNEQMLSALLPPIALQKSLWRSFRIKMRNKSNRSERILESTLRIDARFGINLTRSDGQYSHATKYPQKCPT